MANLLNSVGNVLSPKIFCVAELAEQGAAHPDFGLYTAKQVEKGRPRRRQVPERGVIEVKGLDYDAWLTAQGDQVSRYGKRYRMVLVTELRDFVLVGEDESGRPAHLEQPRGNRGTAGSGVPAGLVCPRLSGPRRGRGRHPSLKAVRSAHEESLGFRFEGERGARFFHSTLVKTLFYGVISAWVVRPRQAIVRP